MSKGRNLFKNRINMKATIEKIRGGEASGKQLIRVESNRGKLLGWIQVTNVDWTPVLGGTTLYIVQNCHDGNYSRHLASTIAEAFSKLGVSLKELDNSELPLFKEFWLKRY